MKRFYIPKSSIRQNIKLAWFFTFLISLSLTTFEIYYFCVSGPQVNLNVLLYHGILLIAKSASSVAHFVFYKSVFEFCQLFNLFLHLSFKNEWKTLQYIQCIMQTTIFYFQLWFLVSRFFSYHYIAFEFLWFQWYSLVFTILRS